MEKKKMLVINEVLVTLELLLYDLKCGVGRKLVSLVFSIQRGSRYKTWLLFSFGLLSSIFVQFGHAAQ